MTEKQGITEQIWYEPASKYVDSIVNEKGQILDISFKNYEHFNFAYDVVDVLAQKNPDKLGLLYIDAHKEVTRYSFKDISEEANRVANYFVSLGIKKGDRVMLVLRRHVQFWFSILALHKIGAIAIPSTDLLVADDFAYRFTSANVNAVVCTSYGAATEQVEKGEKESGVELLKIVVGGEKAGWQNFNKEYKGFAPEFPRNDSEDAPGGFDPMLLYFTSGTTAHPKMVLHNYQYPLGHYVTAKYWHKVDPNGLHFTVSDTGWGKAMWGKLYGQWLCNAAVVVDDYVQFSARNIVGNIEKFGITTFCGPPTLYRTIIKMDLSKFDLSTLQRCTTAGEALNPEVSAQFFEATGLSLYEAFGQTETTLLVGTFFGDEIHQGTLGRVNPMYKTVVLDEEDNVVPDGEVGELCIDVRDGAPFGLFMGYYNDDNRTSLVQRNGFYHTGDNVYKDPDDFYHYVGRADDVIKASGYRISPFEIESVIMQLRYVMECAVTSVPDPLRGNAIKAHIVLIKGVEPTEELKKIILSHIRSCTASYKWPKYIEFTEELPKTISGKVIHRALRGK